jgi:hypothetical protein
MTEIYLTKLIENGSREIVVEGDDHSIWTYVISHNDERKGIEFDGFVCSRGTMVLDSEEVKKYIDSDFAPPLMKEYSNEYSIQREIEGKDIEISWCGDYVSVILKGVEFLVMDLKKQQSFSKSTIKIGPYGIPIDQKTLNLNSEM